MTSGGANFHEAATVSDSASIGDGTRVGCGAVVGDNAVIGLNVDIGKRAIILEDVLVHSYSRILDGAVVAETVAARSIVGGNPARTVGFVDTADWKVEDDNHILSASGRIPIGIGSCELTRLSSVLDSRGSLLPIELDQDLPFIPRRLFYVYGVVEGAVRGQHAHRACDQLLFAISGGLTVVLDDGSASIQIRLDRPDIGIYLPAGVWVTHYQFTEHAVLAVLAELPYEPQETIDDYDAYLSWRSDSSGDIRQANSRM